MRTIMIIRRYRSALDTKEEDQKGHSIQRRNSDDWDRDGRPRSSEDRRGSTSKGRRKSTDKERITTEFIEEGFLQICGLTEGREMQAVQDILGPLEEAPYKLQCTCPHCISYSYEVASPDKQYTEPFMRAINLVFSTISKYGYALQSTSAVQNADQSSTTTWVWVRTAASEQAECVNEEEDNRPRRKH